MRLMGLLLLLLVFITGDVVAQVRVKGYYRKNGTYVAPHYRSNPNSSRFDNYSSRGNYNPYTGRRGTVNPYASPSVPAQPIYDLPPLRYPLWSVPSPTAPRTNRWWATEPQQDTETIESARSALRALEAKWQQIDPFYEQRIPVLRGRLGAISVLPPSQWEPTLEREYWAIPATKTSLPYLIAQYSGDNEVCAKIDSARSELEHETKRLLRCVRGGDYSDHCITEFRGVRSATANLEDAISGYSSICHQ